MKVRLELTPMQTGRWMPPSAGTRASALASEPSFVSVLALIWAVVLAIGALVSIVKVLRLKRSSA